MNTLDKETVKFKLNQIGYGKEFVVIFYKVNGEQRKMRCMMEPPTGEPKNPNVVPVMDLDKGAWRSFKVDSVSFLGEAQ
jgi:hypothetical protein